MQATSKRRVSPAAVQLRIDEPKVLEAASAVSQEHSAAMSPLASPPGAIASALNGIDTSAGRNSRERSEFDERILHQLLSLNPDSTMDALREIDDNRRLERFWRFCRTNALKPENFRTVHSIDQLNSNMSMIVRSIRAVLRSSQYLCLLSKRMIAGVHRVQRFIRRELAKLKKKKAAILELWKEAEKTARLHIRQEVEARARRLRSTQNARTISDMWDVYLDCWVPEERKVRVIDHLWRERRTRYLRKFREWKTRGVAQLGFTGSETLTTRKSRIGQLCLQFPPLRFCSETITIAELAAHDHLVHLRDIMAGLRGTSNDRRLSLVPWEVGDVDGWQHPVSFYHQLLTFDRSKMHLCVFVKQLSKPEGLRLPPGAPSSVRQQATEAKLLYARWNEAILPVDTVNTLRGIAGGDVDQGGRRRRARRHHVDDSGQPVSMYSPEMLHRRGSGSGSASASRSPSRRPSTSPAKRRDDQLDRTVTPSESLAGRVVSPPPAARARGTPTPSRLPTKAPTPPSSARPTSAKQAGGSTEATPKTLHTGRRLSLTTSSDPSSAPLPRAHGHQRHSFTAYMQFDVRRVATDRDEEAAHWTEVLSMFRDSLPQGTAPREFKARHRIDRAQSALGSVGVRPAPPLNKKERPATAATQPEEEPASSAAATAPSATARTRILEDQFKGDGYKVPRSTRPASAARRRTGRAALRPVMLAADVDDQQTVGDDVHFDPSGAFQTRRLVENRLARWSSVQ